MPIPMITALTLGRMPELLAQECGERALAQAFARSGLVPHLRYDRNHFITQASLKAFVAAGSRALGERDLGLMAMPWLSVRDYGLWGKYVLSAPTLGDALRRAQSALCYHSTFDTVHIVRQGDEVRFVYRFAQAHGSDYENVAYVAAAVMLSIVRAYLGDSWNPAWVELDIDKRSSRSGIEQALHSQARLGARAVAFPVPVYLLDSRQTIPIGSPTLADVHRDRRGRAPSGLVEIVESLARMQLLDSQPDLEHIARRLDMGPRSLQRQLEREGMSFRELTQNIMMKRAMELLYESDLSVTHIAAELSYSSPANFARAFRRQTGMSPRQYRRIITREKGVTR